MIVYGFARLELRLEEQALVESRRQDDVARDGEGGVQNQVPRETPPQALLGFVAERRVVLAPPVGHETHRLLEVAEDQRRVEVTIGGDELERQLFADSNRCASRQFCAPRWLPCFSSPSAYFTTVMALLPRSLVMASSDVSSSESKYTALANLRSGDS